MNSYEDVEDFTIEKRGQAIQHPQVQECNQKSWHLPEDCALNFGTTYFPYIGSADSQTETVNND